jgi:hypothetical protein
MNDKELRHAYERAFLEQARSDWRVYRLLAERAEHKCHELHYLQMATEKLAKAYRLRETQSPISELVRHHTGFEKFVRQYLLSARNRERYQGKTEQLKSLVKQFAKLAAEIEKLAPAIDRANAPENAEYPWETGDSVIAPCEWSFPALELLRAHSGRALLKTVALALEDFDHAHRTA